MKDYKYRDGFAYKMYQKAEENLESGVAVEELVERILKQVIGVVDFGKTMARVNIEPAYIQTALEAKDVLEDMGFKVMTINDKEMVLIWDFSKEEAEEAEEAEEGGNEFN